MYTILADYKAVLKPFTVTYNKKAGEIRIRHIALRLIKLKILS
jgi:hypothetical protein